MGHAHRSTILAELFCRALYLASWARLAGLVGAVERRDVAALLFLHRRRVNLLARGAVCAGILRLVKILPPSHENFATLVGNIPLAIFACSLVFAGRLANAHLALCAVGRRVALAHSATGLCGVRLAALRGKQAQGDQVLHCERRTHCR